MALPEIDIQPAIDIFQDALGVAKVVFLMVIIFGVADMMGLTKGIKTRIRNRREGRAASFRKRIVIKRKRRSG